MDRACLLNFNFSIIRQGKWNSFGNLVLKSLLTYGSSSVHSFKDSLIHSSLSCCLETSTSCMLLCRIDFCSYVISTWHHNRKLGLFNWISFINTWMSFLTTQKSFNILQWVLVKWWFYGSWAWKLEDKTCLN